jgi:hypothetical protein
VSPAIQPRRPTNVANRMHVATTSPVRYAGKMAIADIAYATSVAPVCLTLSAHKAHGVQATAFFASEGPGRMTVVL